MLKEIGKYPFVSVIIPTKNEEKNIGHCIEGIRSCGYPEESYEVIVVDNGSSDRTVDIAEQKGAKVILSPESKISGLRNIGVANAKGEFIAFLDADCMACENWISFGVHDLEHEGVIACGAMPLAEENATWVQKTWEFNSIGKKEKMIVDWLSSMNFFVKKDVFMKVNGFDEILATCEDVDLCYRMKRYGDIMSDKKIRVIHLGEPKTVKGFFYRELWQGQSSFKGVLKHGIVLGEIPSLIIPFYTFIMLCFILGSIFYGKFIYFLASCLMLLLPSILLAIKKSFIKKEVKYFPKLLVLYMTFSVARMIAIFINIKYQSKRKAKYMESKS